MTTDHKDVEIRGQQFRVNRLSATDGGWIAILLTTRMREQAEREAAAIKKASRKASAQEVAAAAASLTYEDGMMMTANFLISTLSRQELSDIQSACLSRCAIYGTLPETPHLAVPILDGSRWLYPELEYDAPTCLDLLKHSLAFNIAPFFPAPVSQE